MLLRFDNDIHLLYSLLNGLWHNRPKNTIKILDCSALKTFSQKY